jgi:subtilase family serine protease
LDSSISVPPVPRRPANDEIKLGSSVHNNLDDFKGRIDEIRLYNRALNAGEIKAKYDAFGRADLGLAASDITISPSTTVVNGTSLSISASVRNLGPSTLSSSSVKFYKGDPATGGIQIGTTQTITNLACNGSKQVSISWTPDIAGTYPIYVEISGTTPMDTNLGNDRAFVAIIVLSKPDLSVTTADIVTSMSKIVEGGMVNISVTIRNYGQWDASSVVVRFLDGANQIGTDVIIPSVKGNGGSAQATVTWKASPKGEHVITVRIDPNGLISESDEANNMANLTITVKSRQIQTKTPGFESACAGIAITISLAMIYHRRRKSNV